MKKILRFIFTMLFVGSMSTSAFALLPDKDPTETDPFNGCEMPSNIFSVDDIYYQIIEEEAHEVAVISLLDNTGHIILGDYSELESIPETVSYNGELYHITALGNTAFLGSKDMTIPDNITYMCGAFRGSDFSELKLPSQLTIIGNDCLEACNELVAIDLPAPILKIGDRSFSSNSNLEKVIFGNNLIELGELSFAMNQSLKEAILPNSVRVIGYSAFNSCRSLEKVKLPRYLPFAYRGKGEELEMFNICPNIRVIEWESETPMDLPNCFKQVNKALCTVVVPDGFSKPYIESEYWGQFDIVEKSEYQASIASPEVAKDDTATPKYYLLNGVEVT